MLPGQTTPIKILHKPKYLRGLHLENCYSGCNKFTQPFTAKATHAEAIWGACFGWERARPEKKNPSEGLVETL